MPPRLYPRSRYHTSAAERLPASENDPVVPRFLNFLISRNFLEIKKLRVFRPHGPDVTAPPPIFFFMSNGCEVRILNHSFLFVHTVLVTAAVAAIYQLLAVYAIIFDDTPARAEKRRI